MILKQRFNNSAVRATPHRGNWISVTLLALTAHLASGCGEQKQITDGSDMESTELVQALNPETGEIRRFTTKERPEEWLPCPENGSCFDLNLSCEQVGPKLCVRLKDCEITPISSFNNQTYNTKPTKEAASKRFRWYFEHASFTCVATDSVTIDPPISPVQPINCDDDQYHPGDEILSHAENKSDETKAWRNSNSPAYYENREISMACEDELPVFDDCGEVIDCEPVPFQCYDGVAVRNLCPLDLAEYMIPYSEELLVCENVCLPYCSTKTINDGLFRNAKKFEEQNIKLHAVWGNSDSKPGEPLYLEDHACVEPPKPQIPTTIDDVDCTNVPTLFDNLGIEQICRDIEDEYNGAVQFAKRCYADEGNNRKQCTKEVRASIGPCSNDRTIFINLLSDVLDTSSRESLLNQWLCYGCDQESIVPNPYQCAQDPTPYFNPEIDSTECLHATRTEKSTLDASKTSSEIIMVPPSYGSCITSYRSRK